MPGYTTAVFFALQVLLTAFLLSRASSNMTSPPSKQWADSPCPLIQTPQFKTKKMDIFTVGATHMSHIHNAILRGYNSIYHQAPLISHEDKDDFIGYCLAWSKFVQSHHDSEEGELFPTIEDALGRKDLFEETHREHEAFLPGLARFASYLATLGEPYDFDGGELVRIMETFQRPFCQHFHAEIKTIAAFADLPEASRAEEAAAVFKAWGKKTVSKAGTTDVVPFFLLNHDVTYEEGMWAAWPPMPAPVRWGLVNLAGAWHWAWWKFASCDAGGRPRDLWALVQPRRPEMGARS
ncbi:hypothetical protein DPSP01_004637 [Paraphaeosphaeria sporulosa]|uniref:Hemerythrin-like domain-containing protein n=1 Tax=Paraphaeosphaeria sporulosa TaxID=1460663 RepID=A0A177CBA2_9PLEO|nr:uncharacterized protein CC84DRAFT_884580 [Paraphaeosphaeria sporulosa]OAG04057.1 hypothetical protein CC84DRAFT_884580 [Paraphaeosphaeria sporulosa]